MRLVAPHQGAEEDQQIDHPHDGEPKVGVPFRLGVFLRLGDAEEIAGAGDDDEEIVAQHDEPGRQIADEARAAGALHDIERRCDQHIAAEGEDHRGGVQRPQPAERDERQIEIERREGELERDPQPDGESGNAPEHGKHRCQFDGSHIVVGLAVDHQRRWRVTGIEVPIKDRKHGRHASGGEQIGVESKFGRIGFGSHHDRINRKCREGDGGAAFAEAHVSCLCLRLRHKSPRRLQRAERG